MTGRAEKALELGSLHMQRPDPCRGHRFAVTFYSQQALDLANSLGLEMPATALGRDLYDKLIAAGDGDLDHSALIKAIDWP